MIFFCRGGTSNGVFHRCRVDRPGRGGCVDSPSLLMEKKGKKKKPTQCEFCSLTDFGSKSAENKAVSVQLPYVGFWSVLRFYKVALQRDTSGPSLT